jgi:hypothetical protein
MTKMDKTEDQMLLTQWRHNERWPRVAEEATGIMGTGEDSDIFTNFCPEVAGDFFGWFASYLAGYADEIDKESAHRLLGRERDSSSEDHRWAWQLVIPMHYSECPLYAPLTKGKPMTDYWSMSDDELELLGDKFNLHPLSRTGENLEQWYVDRERIIEQLIKRDKALRAGTETPSSNVVNVGNMYSSSIQQGTRESIVKIAFSTNDPHMGEVLAGLKTICERLDPKEPARQQVLADVGTIEAQLTSPHPKSSVITECLRSAKTILEGAAGSLLAAGASSESVTHLIHRIGALLGG